MLCHFVLGTRPEIIKLAPVLDTWNREGHELRIIHSGQHYDFEMDQVFFRELGLPRPNVSLNVGSTGPVHQTASIIAGVARVLDADDACAVVVQGDTNTTLGGALAAVKHPNSLLAHVESGCRSFNRAMPEETNRIVTDHVSGLRFAATTHDMENLRREGLTANSYLVGSTGIESCLRNAPLAIKKSDLMRRLSLRKRDFALVTIHRAGNTMNRDGLVRIMSALAKLSETLPVVFPVHPRTSAALKGFGIRWPRGIRRIGPVGYLDFLALLANARLVLTDSGGIQEEAAVLGTRCFTLRDETEWTFTVDAGVNTLVGDSEDRIVEAALGFIEGESRPRALQAPWIDGLTPSQHITRRLREMCE